MFSLDIETTQPDRDLLISELFEAGSTGINESSDAFLRAFFDDEQAAQASASHFGGTVQPADTTDWVIEAQRSLEPQLVGERFFLVPQWRDDATPRGRFRIAVNNGLAFGTGKHESTRLCLALLEQWVTPGITVLDIGTGTGILSEAAKHLGAGRVFACDIDHTAAEIATAHGIAAFTGSADAIDTGVADLVVANITPETITALKDELPRILKPEGTLLLSGLELHDQVPFATAETHTEGNWKALIVRNASTA